MGDELAAEKEKAEAAMVAAWGPMAATMDFDSYKKLVANNFAKSTQLGELGGSLNDLSVLYERIETILEFLHPVGTADRLTLELRWQRKIKVSLDDAIQGAKAAREEYLKARTGLAVPANSLIVPGQ